ncbi:hypothetical protein RP726_05570 [Candidatus Methylospira mobilis]|uniref:hypothetical protein n=1 Tax=Candidatus Methylospira mobilis TaxID=1808979 RepID=UPI0028E1F61F|nr:hypothetical protein [Candidatus Methylospira mobilis]WNV05880.1 hypothetical protein RP726_05570 [Candidatus Methylospira mobilis]
MFEVSACIAEKNHHPTIICPPLPNGLVPPKGRITGYFGRRDRIALLQFARYQYQLLNERFFRVDLLMDVQPLRSRQNWGNIGQSSILNLTSVCVDIESDLIDYAINQTNMEVDSEKGILFTLISKDTNIINILFDHPTFSQIKAIVWGIAKPAGGYLPVATIRNTADIDKISALDYPGAHDWAFDV